MYQAAAGSNAKVMARGLGVLPADKQLEELMGWLQAMDAQQATAATALSV